MRKSGLRNGRRRTKVIDNQAMLDRDMSILSRRTNWIDWGNIVTSVRSRDTSRRIGDTGRSLWSKVTAM